MVGMWVEAGDQGTAGGLLPDTKPPDPTCTLPSPSRAGTPDVFAQSVDIDSGHTYLLRAGLWEHGLKQGPRLLERYSKARPYGPINSSAKKLKPVQLALMLMAQVEGELEGLCPHISVEMGLFVNK